MPWATLGTTVGEMVENIGGTQALVEIVLDRILKLLAWDGSGSPVEWVKEGLVDPIRVFVKNENHTEKKQRDKAWRLISSISIVDGIIERVLYGEQNRAEIELWKILPVCPGMGLDDDSIGVLNQRMAAWETAGATLFTSDVSGFDWSVTDEMLRADTEVRIRLSGASPDGPFAKLLRNRQKLSAQAVFILSDGRTFTQLSPGIMKSGSQITASANSKIRWMLAELVADRLGYFMHGCLAMGDDCVEAHMHLEGPRVSEQDVVATYRRYGVVLTDVCRRSLKDGVEFCSHSFNGDKASPTAPDKQVASMLYKRPQTEEDAHTLASTLAQNLRHSPEMMEIAQVVSSAGWGAAKILKEDFLKYFELYIDGESTSRAETR